MTGMLIIAAILVAMGPLASRFGADTRDGRDWREEPPERDPTTGERFPDVVSRA